MTISNLFETIRRQWIVVAGVLALGLLAFVILLPALKKFSATSTLLVTSAQENSAALDPNKDPTSGALSASDLSALLGSSTIVSRVTHDLALTGEEARRIGGEIKAKLTPGSGILPITVTDRDAKISVAGANAAARELSLYDIQIKTKRYDQMIADVDRQLAQSRRRLGVIDSRISDLGASDAYLSQVNGTEALSARLVTLEGLRDQLVATLDGDRAAAAIADRRPELSRSLAAREIETGDPALTQIKTQYGKDVALLNTYRSGYTSKFAGVAAQSALVDSEQQRVTSEVDGVTSDPRRSAAYVATLLDANKANAAVHGDLAQLGDVQGQLATLTQHLRSSADATSTLSRLRRDRTSEEATYLQLAQSEAKAETDRAQAASIDSVVVVDTASAAFPTTFSRPELLAPAIAIVALWLAITIAFMVDRSDRRLNSRESIEALYGKPVFNTFG